MVVMTSVKDIKSFEETLPEGEQLASVIDNLESIGMTSKCFSKKLVNELVK